MSTPQGPGRYGADPDPERSADPEHGTPTWGTPPPGGWGRAEADRDGGPGTQAWEQPWDEPWADDDGVYHGRRRAEDRPEPMDGDWGAPPADAPWGDPVGAGDPPPPSGRRRSPYGDPGRGDPAPGDPGSGGDPRYGGDRGDPRYREPAYGEPGYEEARFGDDGLADPRYAPDPRHGDDRTGAARFGEPGFDGAGFDGAGFGEQRYPDPRSDDPPRADPGFGGARHADPWSEGPGATAAWGADPAREDAFAPGDEPWAPREAVHTPWRGPGGLGARALGAIGAGVVVVAVLAVLLFVTPGWAVTRTLDRTALQNGVTKILKDDYGLQLGAVQCPDDVAVETGTVFSCQAVVDGEQVSVPGTVTSDNGDYQVSRV